MDATELYLKDGKATGVFYCGKCRIVHRTEGDAARCCEPYKCDRCGKEIQRYYTRCDECRWKDEAQKERERFEKAEKVITWDGWVYLEGTGNEGFSDSLETFLDEWNDDHDPSDPKPRYVWACKANHFVCASLDDITEPMKDAAYEDWEPDSLEGLDELKAALDKFNQVNAAVCSYEPDYTKAVLLNND